MLTIADLEATPDDGQRYEIIEGELYVSSAPGYLHQSVLMNIAWALLAHLKQNPIGKVLPGVGVIFDDNNGVVPDLIFLTNERRRQIVRGGRLTAAPEIVIEILSPGSSNQRRDRQIKLTLYAAREVGEYWIVDPENRSVELYRRGAESLEFIATLSGTDRIESPALPAFTVPVSDFFAD
jgi:Uma2 family endonuclease